MATRCTRHTTKISNLVPLGKNVSTLVNLATMVKRQSIAEQPEEERIKLVISTTNNQHHERKEKEEKFVVFADDGKVKNFSRGE